MVDPAIEAAIIGFLLATFAGGVGWFLRDLRDRLEDLEEEASQNSEFRRVMTGEEMAHDGELPQIDESFADLTREIEEMRHERAKEHRETWEALAAIHETIANLVDAINDSDVNGEVDRPDHPYEYRRGDSDD